jgi:hypothetical protein
MPWIAWVYSWTIDQCLLNSRHQVGKPMEYYSPAISNIIQSFLLKICLLFCSSYTMDSFSIDIAISYSYSSMDLDIATRFGIPQQYYLALKPTQTPMSPISLDSTTIYPPTHQYIQPPTSPNPTHLKAFHFLAHNNKGLVGTSLNSGVLLLTYS